MSDHAGHVLVLHEDQMPGEGRLAIDPIHLDQPWISKEHRTLHHRDAGIRFQFQANRIGVAGARLVPLGQIPAALPGDLHGVDQVGALGHRPLQHARQACIAQQVGVVLADASEISQPHRLDVPGGDVGRKTPQPLGDVYIRPQRAVLLGRKRRHVDRVQRHAVLQILDHLLGDAHAHDLLRFFGRAANVRRRQHFVSRE